VVLLSLSDGVGVQGVSVTTGVLHGAPEAGAMSLAAWPPQEEVSGVRQRAPRCCEPTSVTAHPGSGVGTPRRASLPVTNVFPGWLMTFLGVISCSHGNEYVDGCLLECCAVQAGRIWPTFQRCRAA
jgi:hypothetical protein